MSAASAQDRVPLAHVACFASAMRDREPKVSRAHHGVDLGVVELTAVGAAAAGLQGAPAAAWGGGVEWVLGRRGQRGIMPLRVGDA